MLVISKFEIAADRTECWSLTDPFWIKVFFLCTVSIFFFLPLIALVILYVVIAEHLMANPGISTSSSNTSALRYRRQVILMLGTVVFIFFVCLLPYRALIMWIILAPIEFQLIYVYGYETYYKIICFCRFMFYLNSAINPILYNLMSSKFRDGFRKLCGLRCCCPVRLGRKGTVTTTTGLTGTSSSQKMAQDTPPSSSIHHSGTGDSAKKKASTSELITAANISPCSSGEGFMKKLSVATNIVRLQENYV